MNQQPKKAWAAPTLRRLPITPAIVAACSADVVGDDFATSRPKRAARG